jgi:hypothetical protein
MAYALCIYIFGKEPLATAGCFQASEFHRLLSGDKTEETTVVCVPFAASCQ